VAERLDAAAIARLTEPANYLGAADDFIDRVLAAARAGS
jgi:adenylosuccinate lyase